MLKTQIYQRRSSAAVTVLLIFFSLISFSLFFYLYGPRSEAHILESPHAPVDDNVVHLNRTTLGQKIDCVDRMITGQREGKSRSRKSNNTISGNAEKLAYVTWLSATTLEDGDEDLEHDNYFLATRILVWQLLHVPRTRTKGIDVVVMVTPRVSKSRITRLRQDGAIVHTIDFLQSETHWEKGDSNRWNNVMSKLRVWQMTQYDRILMLDSDVMLLHPLDGVFDDPAAQIRPTVDEDEDREFPETNNPTKFTPIEGIELPSTYLLASLSEIDNSNHDFPPTYTTGIKTPSYFNAGFFMLAPSEAVFEYYVALLNTPNSFDPRYPEQNLLNTAHHWKGPMPWKELSYKWNIREPNENDFKKGVVSVHEKWWDQPFIYDNQKVKDWLRSRRWVMQGWYTVYDALLHNRAISC
ncbi:hypothetical protein ACN47E_004305 [Coniothyrium glycines]